MARYYFNFRSSQNIVLDEKGLDLLDVRAAREKALAFVRQDCANAIKTGSVPEPYSIIITDAFGREVATIATQAVFPKILGPYHWQGRSHSGLRAADLRRRRHSSRRQHLSG
jgi:hypothetical protein